MFFLPLLSFSILAQTADKASEPFEIKCYVSLDRGEGYIYALHTDKLTDTPSSIKQEIVGTKLFYRNAKRKRTIEKVHECVFGDEVFVNVKAIRLDETRLK